MSFVRSVAVAASLLLGGDYAGASPLQGPPLAPADAKSQALELVKQAQKANNSGKQDEAITLYRRALELNPALFDAYLGVGYALDLKGEYEPARQSLTKAVELGKDEDLARALNGVAVSFAFEGKTKEVASAYQKVFDRRMNAQSFSEAAGTANALGRVYVESGDLENGLKWYRTGYETARRQPDRPSEELDLWEMRWLHAQGRIAARKGNTAEAQTHAKAVKALIDKGGKNAVELPIYQYLAGYIALYARQYDQAIEALLKGDLTDPFVLMLLAQAHEKRGDGRTTREYCERIMQSNNHTLQVAFARPFARKCLAKQ